MTGFGGSVKLTGESEYRKAIQQITQDLGKMSSALKSQASDFSANDKSVKNASQAQKELNDSLKTQQAELAKAKSAYANYSVAVQTQTTRHNALTKEYKNAVTELDRIGRECGETSEEYQKQVAVVDKLGNELAQSTEELNESKSAMSALKSEINNANRVVNTTTANIDKLGKETEDSGKKARDAGDGYSVFKNILANLGTQAINAAINGLKSLGSAVVNVGKQAIDSYANYEQLEGGVKKIFGDDMAKEVIANADKAFSTAGMSANEYMETVTGFSATLLQGLGDDTSKAATYADTAIRNMSDNANTFGTDMASIQNAYQGFAKGNFTMLDNLRLGYGGTQAEMARLINESGVLGDSMEVTAETVKNVPFHTMIEAIDVTQQRMGIMGTTANEAAGTIQGSTGSMRAAWQNLLTGMVDDSANMEQLTTNFVNTLITPDGQGGVLGTLIPRISQVITGMSNALVTLLPMLIKQVVPIITDNLPIIITAVEGALETILGLLPEIMPVISGLIPQICSTIVGLLPEILDAGIQIILSLIDGISETIPQLLEMLPDLIKNMVDVIIQNLPMIIEAAIELILALVEGLNQAIPQLIDYIPEIIGTIVEVLINNLPMIIDGAIQIMTALINGLIQSLPSLIAMVPRIIFTIVKTLISNLPQILTMGVKILASLIQGIGQNIGQLFTKMSEIAKTVINGVKELPDKVKEYGKNLVKGLWQGIKDMKDWVLDKIKGFASAVTDGIKSFFGIASPSKLFRDEIGTNLALGIGEGFSDEMKHVSSEMADSIPKNFDVQASVNGSSEYNMNNYSFAHMVEAFKAALSQMKIELDDEVAGEFVEKTVTRVIYT